MSREILSTKTVHKLSRHVRAYISAYYSLYESKCNGDDNTPVLTLPLIEGIVKAFKTNRAAIDFDAGFMNGFVPVLQSVIAKNGAVEGPSSSSSEDDVVGESGFPRVIELQLNF
jgi:hypothetical protein